MRYLFIILICTTSVFAISLQEKIQMAKNAADASVEAEVNKRKNDNDKIQASPNNNEKKQNKSNSKQKYVVDVDADFINGRYIGRIGQSKAERDDILKSIEKVDKIMKSEKNYVVSQTDMFTIISADGKALSDVKSLVKAFENVFNNTFSGPEIKNSTIIRVFSDKTQMKDVLLASDTLGNEMTIDLKWSKNLKLDEVIWTLFRSVFEKQMLFEAHSTNSKISVNYPEWLQSALVGCVLDEVTLGIPTYYARLASDYPHKDVISILAYPMGEKNLDLRKAHSYWLFKALQKLSNKRNLYLFVRNVIDGLSVNQTFAEIVKLINLSDYKNLDYWLGCVMCAKICARSGGVISCETSYSELLRLCSLRAFENGEPISVPFDKLFTKSQIVKESAKVRLAEIKMLLVKINPVFFNASVSLGAVYEAFVKDDKTAYDLHMKQFMEEFSRAIKISKEVSNAIK